MDRRAGSGAGVIPCLHGRVLGPDADLAFGRAARACPAQGQARRSCPHGPLRSTARIASFSASSLTREPNMLLHLPIAILATLSPIPVSDMVPTFDIVKECRYEGGSAANVERCSQDETAALWQLKMEWVQFVGADKRPCMETTQIGGFASYIRLLTCLEMGSDLVSANANTENLRAKAGS